MHKGKEQRRHIWALYLLTDFYLKNGYNVILEGVLSSWKNKKLRIDRFRRLGKRRGAKVTMVYMKVDLRTSVKRRKRKEFVMTPGYVKKIHEMSVASRHNYETEIDANGKKPETVAKEILSSL